MKVLIIEDEYPSALRLQKMLEELNSEIQILNILGSVEKSVAYIQKHEDIDLLFFGYSIGRRDWFGNFGTDQHTNSCGFYHCIRCLCY